MSRHVADLRDELPLWGLPHERVCICGTTFRAYATDAETYGATLSLLCPAARATAGWHPCPDCETPFLDHHPTYPDIRFDRCGNCRERRVPRMPRSTDGTL